MTIAAAVVAIILIALAGGVYMIAPSLFGNSETTLPPVTPAPTAVLTTVPTLVQETVATPAITTIPTALVTTVPATASQILIPQTGVWVRVLYEGSFSGSAGAPGRFRDIAGTGNNIYQLSVRDEMVSAMIQKGDNSGKRLTVEIYSAGNLINSGSVTAPKGTVNINADLRTP